DDPTLKASLRAFESDGSRQLSIEGYSDCVGSEGEGLFLRKGRAKRVFDLLGPSAKTRTTFGPAPLGEYITDNSTAEHRAINRGAVIKSVHPLPPARSETQSDTVCGPDVTSWFLDQVTAAKSDSDVKRAQLSMAMAIDILAGLGLSAQYLAVA